MKVIKLDIVRNWYVQHRRANFAASQRLEGITHPVASDDPHRTLPSKTDLLKKYRAASGA